LVRVTQVVTRSATSPFAQLVSQRNLQADTEYFGTRANARVPKFRSLVKGS
jgi:hypothetical protein